MNSTRRQILSPTLARRFSQWLLAGFAGLLCSVMASAAELSGTDLLKKMISASKQTNYQGSFLYARGDEIQLMNVVHRVVDGVEQERIWHVDGERVEMIRNGQKLICYHPSEGQVTLDHTIPAGPYAQLLSAEFEQGLNYYEHAIVGTDRVANHEATVLTVLPMDRQRYSYRMWIHPQSGLLLRTELIDLSGQTMERFQFVNVTIGADISDEQFSTSHLSQHHSHTMSLTHVAKMREQGEMMWQPRWLPDGYKLKDANIRKVAEARVDRLVYSDGLSTFSIFVEPADVGMPLGTTQMGATVAVVKKLGDYHVTLIGEVPLALATRVAESLAMANN